MSYRTFYATACAILALVILTVAAAPAFAQTGGTVVHGGDILASILAWAVAAFALPVGAFLARAAFKFMQKMGIETTQQQKDQLQSIIVNGINAAAAKSETSLKGNGQLDVTVKNKIVADAVSYTQAHAADTIKALGLDPQSGQAVEAIKARIATALADPASSTDPRVTPKNSGGMVEEVK